MQYSILFLLLNAMLDERECFAADDFRCTTTGACIRNVQVCDGAIHCSDESDEINCCNKFVMCLYIIYITLVWTFKGTTWCLTLIFPRQYQDIAWAISWESGLPMTLIPSQSKESMRFGILSDIELCNVGLIFLVAANLSAFPKIDYLVVTIA